MDKENVVYIYVYKNYIYIYIYGISYSNEKEGNAVICDNMNGPWEHFSKWNMSEKEG